MRKIARTLANVIYFSYLCIEIGKNAKTQIYNNMKKYLLFTIVFCLLAVYPAQVATAASAQIVTSEDPAIYTVIEIMDVYTSLNLSSGSKSTNIYTVRGYVTKWKSGYPNYQNADFFIDDSEEGSTSRFECFRLKASDNADKRALSVGEYVEATGYLQNYNGKPEMVDGTFHTMDAPGGDEPGGGDDPGDDYPTIEPKCHSELEGLKGLAIRDALNEQIAEHTVLYYEDVRGDKAKVDLRADGTMWDIYSTCTFNKSDYCTSSNYDTETECDCYNREHILPVSFWGGSKAEPMYTDLHHIYSTDNATNQKRSAWPYAEVTGQVEWSNALGTKLGYNYGYSTTVFEPADRYKGDVARIYFYMVTCYKNKQFNKGGKGYLMFTWDGTECGFSDKAIKCLLKWHRNDPVSQKEIDRNNKVAQKQGNRNPFVDDPELAEYIWGNKKDEAYACPSDGIEDIVLPSHANVTKIIVDGHLYILREGDIFTVTGERVK